MDSPLEGTGFEPSVPPKKRQPSREAPRPTIVVSRDDLCLMTPSSLSVGHLPSATAETFRKSGTDGSNPVPSTGESRANLTSSIRAPKLRSATACSLASLRRSVRHADFAGAKRASNFLEEVSAHGRRSRSLAVLCIHLEPRACLLLEGDQGFEFPPSESKSCRRWAI